MTALSLISRQPYGYLVDLRHIRRDFRCDGMAVSATTALPMRRSGGLWQPMNPAHTTAHLKRAGPLWGRHEREQEDGELRSGVLYYLSPHMAVCKTGRAKPHRNGETAPCVLLGPTGVSAATLHTDEHVLCISDGPTTLYTFRYRDMRLRSYRPTPTLAAAPLFAYDPVRFPHGQAANGPVHV